MTGQPAVRVPGGRRGQWGLLWADGLAAMQVCVLQRMLGWLVAFDVGVDWRRQPSMITTHGRVYCIAWSTLFLVLVQVRVVDGLHM